MCGRYSLTVTKSALQARFPGDGAALTHVPRFNIAPSQRAPVLTAPPTGRQWLMAAWGFPGAGSSRVINARIETLSERPMFRGSLERGRCLVPADGFFEWARAPAGRSPRRFVLRDRSLFAMAGLWADAPKPGEPPAFVIVTTRANDRVGRYHDRMPVLLDRSMEAAWLDSDRSWPELRKALSVPFPADALEDYAVSQRVNSPKCDTPECIAPASGTGQGELW